MADDLVILAQFVKLGRLRKKVFMELAQKEISQICKLGEKKGKYCTSSTYHAVYDLIALEMERDQLLGKLEGLHSSEEPVEIHMCKQVYKCKQM